MYNNNSNNVTTTYDKYNYNNNNHNDDNNNYYYYVCMYVYIYIYTHTLRRVCLSARGAALPLTRSVRHRSAHKKEVPLVLVPGGTTGGYPPT